MAPAFELLLKLIHNSLNLSSLDSLFILIDVLDLLRFALYKYKYKYIYIYITSVAIGGLSMFIICHSIYIYISFNIYIYIIYIYISVLGNIQLDAIGFPTEYQSSCPDSGAVKPSSLLQMIQVMDDHDLVLKAMASD